jgi:hypothetical protein
MADLDQSGGEIPDIRGNFDPQRVHRFILGEPDRNPGDGIVNHFRPLMTG